MRLHVRIQLRIHVGRVRLHGEEELRQTRIPQALQLGVVQSGAPRESRQKLSLQVLEQGCDACLVHVRAHGRIERRPILFLEHLMHIGVRLCVRIGRNAPRVGVARARRAVALIRERLRPMSR